MLPINYSNLPPVQPDRGENTSVIPIALETLKTTPDGRYLYIQQSPVVPTVINTDTQQMQSIPIEQNPDNNLQLLPNGMLIRIPQNRGVQIVINTYIQQMISHTPPIEQDPVDDQSLTGMSLQNRLPVDDQTLTGMSLQNRLPVDDQTLTGMSLQNRLPVDVQSLTAMRLQNRLPVDDQTLTAMRLQNRLPVDDQSLTAMRLQNRLPVDVQSLTTMRLQNRLKEWKKEAESSEDLAGADNLPEDQKNILIEWLRRFKDTQDFVNVGHALAKKVCSILSDVIKNKEFQELFFIQAAANNECCGDRAAMSLNEIYTSWKLICKSENTPLQDKLKLMTGLAKTLRLRKELQKLMIGKDEGESVEIFLFYESTLSERLQLVTAIENMVYTTIGNRSWIDKERLVKTVNDNFFEELFDLPVFQKMMMKEMEQKWEEIDEEFFDRLAELGDCPKGGEEDEIVLNYKHRQGEIMQEWKRAKMAAAKEWYDKVNNY